MPPVPNKRSMHCWQGPIEQLPRSKLENVNLLIKSYKKGKIGSNTVKKELAGTSASGKQKTGKTDQRFSYSKRDDFR